LIRPYDVGVGGVRKCRHIRKLVHRRLAELASVGDIGGDPARQFHQDQRIGVKVGVCGDFTDLIGRQSGRCCGTRLGVGGAADCVDRSLAGESGCREQCTAGKHKIATLDADAIAHIVLRYETNRSPGRGGNTLSSGFLPSLGSLLWRDKLVSFCAADRATAERPQGAGARCRRRMAGKGQILPFDRCGDDGGSGIESGR
jgi:hypothetical protein